MQTRFVLMSYKNTQTDDIVNVAVVYDSARKIWSARKFYRNDGILLNTIGDDPRVAERLRDGVCLTTTDKPLVEIAMLLRRFAKLGSSGLHGYDPADWKHLSSTEYTLAEMAKANNTVTQLMATMRETWNRITHETHDPLTAMNIILRRNNVLMNAAAMALAQAQGAPFLGTGVLANVPGVLWRGTTYSTAEYSALQFKQRSHFQRTVGALIAKAIYCQRQAMDGSGIADELSEMLRENDDVDRHLNQAQRARIDTVLRDKASGITSLVLTDCGHFEHAASIQSVISGGDHVGWCRTCYQHDSVTVVDTNERWARDDACWSDNHDAYYSYDIDAEEDGEDGEPEYEDGSRTILDYSTNVTQILKRDDKLQSSPYGDFLMGIELEMTTGGRSRNTAAKAIQKSLGAKYCVIKNDGSLPEDGLEIVTAPRGLAEHIERFTRWEIDPAWRAWDTDRCGLHVHIHSRAFTEMTLGKFLMFINLDTNAPFIRKIAGRHPLKDNWAARYCAHESVEVLENPKEAIKGKSSERYRMINTQNLGRAEAERLGLDPFRYSGKYDTVEIRVFKASLKRERLLAQIEFTHAAVMFCRVASYRELTGGDFLKWLRPNAANYPHLADWFGTRKSKSIKELGGGQALEVVCADKVVGEMAVPARAVRATRPKKPITGRNQYLTPTARREAQSRELRDRVAAESRRLAEARERAQAAIAAEREAIGRSIIT